MIPDRSLRKWNQRERRGKKKAGAVVMFRVFEQYYILFALSPSSTCEEKHVTWHIA